MCLTRQRTGFALKKLILWHLLGPEYPPVARISNQYLKHVLVKIDKKRTAVPNRISKE
jgi:primosomal protein N' (replication factor Y)